MSKIHLDLEALPLRSFFVKDSSKPKKKFGLSLPRKIRQLTKMSENVTIIMYINAENM
jgi:hypothetical protein